MATRCRTVAVIVLALIVLTAINGIGRQAGTVTGTLKVGSATYRLAHALAVAEKGAKESYVLFVTERPLPAAAAKLALTAASSALDRQNLAVELADGNVRGLQVAITADKQVSRVDVFSPEAVMGVMLLEPPRFEATVITPQRVTGKLASAKPIQDPRLRKTIEYDVTFDVPIARGK